MSDNPNPSGFRSGRYFINLAEVVAVRPRAYLSVFVLFNCTDFNPMNEPRQDDGWVEFDLEPQSEIDRFLDALEVYHSKR